MNNNWFNPYDPINNQSYNRYSRISIEDAMYIALEQIPGEIVKIELDTENGILVYEVDIMTAQGMKYEMDIDAQTGRIIKIKNE